MDHPDDFAIDNSADIFHLPTWRFDLLEDNSFDLIICVQVLPELNKKLLKEVLRQFYRVLKPGGMLYLRDHGAIWKPVYNFNVDKWLGESGFRLEFNPYLINEVDLHGIVRLWRKKDDAVEKSIFHSAKERKRQLIEDIDTLTNGRFTKAVKKLKNK